MPIIAKPAARSIILANAMAGADPLEIRSGPSIPPTERLKLFSSAEWESVVDEWAASLGEYGLVERTGGSGDMGCDVIATVNPDDAASAWDNFQCKHYDHPLAPSDIWIELGKLCYFTFTGQYTLPRKYTFVAPFGIGSKLSRLLKKPNELKQGLLTAWASKCADEISSGNQINLRDDLKEHIESIDFSIFTHLPVRDLIEGHAKTRYFAVRFGLGLPSRPASAKPPPILATEETRYVEQLLAAYRDHLGDGNIKLEQIPRNLQRHFARAREWFYCAEALRNFSRDTLPDGAFEHLQKQILDGVIDICEANHACGLTRVNATTSHAGSLAITSSALVGRFDTGDRHGICHQLANEDKLTWVQTDD